MPKHATLADRITFQLQPKWLIMAVVFAAGSFLGIIGALAWMFSHGRPFAVGQVRQANSQYAYVNPLLAVDTAGSNLFLEDHALDALLARATTQPTGSRPTAQAFYFRDLNTGRWAGQNQDQQLLDVQTLPVITALAYYHLKEHDGTALDRPMTWISVDTGATMAGTAKDALNAALVSGDQTLVRQLNGALDRDFLSSVYTDLGLDPIGAAPRELVSVKSYALIFNVLYNATYVSADDSEAILQALNQSDVSVGIMAAMPNDVPVSHSYLLAKRSSPRGDRENQVADCGIVYRDAAPYLVCGSVAGADLDGMNGLLKNAGKEMRVSADKAAKR